MTIKQGKYLIWALNAILVVALISVGAYMEYSRFLVVRRNFPNVTYFEYISTYDMIRLTKEE